jgi:signal transduction histidine kinase
VESASRLFGASTSVWQMAEDGLLHERVTSVPHDVPVAPVVVDEHSMTGQCIATRRGLLVNDYRHSPYALPRYVAADVRRAMVQPLWMGDRLLGALVMSRKGEDATPFTDDAFASLERLAGLAALALRNATLYEEAERRRREAEALAEVASALTEIRDVDGVAKRIVEAVVELVRGCIGAVVSARRADGSRVVLASHGPLSAFFTPGQILPVGGLIDRVGQDQRPMWLDDLTASELEAEQPQLAARRRELVEAGIRAAVGLPLIARKRVIGVLAMGFGEPRTLSREEIALNQALADHAALALENARLYQEAERRRREVEVMAEIARTVSAALDMDAILQRLAEGACALCKSDIARIALRDPDTGDVVVRYAVNTRYEGYASVRLRPEKRSLGGLVLLTGQPVRTNDWMADPRFDKEAASVIRAEGSVAQMAVPIRIGDQVEGVLYVDNRGSRPFTDVDEAALQQLAEQAAIAIRNAQLFATVQRTSARLQVLSTRLLEVQEAERRHIARELHDEVGQALTAVRINLQLLKRVPPLGATADRIDDSLGIVDRILTGVRRLSLDLHPTTLDDLGLVAALRSHVNAVAERAGLTAVVSIDPLAHEPPPGLAATCFRVVQEALTNAIRHAKATRLEVELRHRSGAIELTIRDDGIGFDVAAARRQALRGESLGLLGLEERVELAGGHVVITSSPGGTEIRARLPLPAPD